MGCFKYAKFGKCKFGRDCRFKHIELPEFMAGKRKKKKLSGKNTSSTSSTSSTPKDFAKQTKTIVKQMLAAERKKKGDEKALVAANQKRMWKRVRKSLKSCDFSAEERQRVKDDFFSKDSESSSSE